MRKEIRRIIMFCTILTVGLLLLFFDVTFIQLIVLVVGIAIILPFLLGLVTIDEVRTAFGTFKEQRLNKIGILKKLDDIKLFEGKGPKKPEARKPPVQPKPEPVAAGKETPSKMPFGAQIRSIAATIGSLGAVLKEKTRRERKEADINKMLDKAVSGKVEPAGVVQKKETRPAGSSLPAPGGAGSIDETDPFLSLSDDEFDAGLLDGLDDMGDISPEPAGAGEPAAGPVTEPVAGPAPEAAEPEAAPDDLGSLPSMDEEIALPEPGEDMGLPEPELSVPSTDAEIDAAASDILKAYGADGDLDDFSGLGAETGGEGAESGLGDLDNISLDDVELDTDFGEEGEEETAEPGEEEEEAAPAAAPAAAAEESDVVKTAWIPSDAPKDADMMQDQIGTQADMAAFAGGSGGTDEDLLSSIASDVKKTVKEKDLSLLRELKDFRAPASQIEQELTDMYQRLSSVKKPKDNEEDSANNEIK